MYKKFFQVLLPLPLLGLLPFGFSMGDFFYTLEVLGPANPYIILAMVGLMALLAADAFFKTPVCRKYDHHFLVISLVVVSLLCRLSLFGFQSDDYIGALSVWFDTIHERGGFQALSDRSLSDYHSTYLYLIALLTYLPFPSLYSIKFVSVIFDYALAWCIWKVVKLQYPEGKRPLVAALICLFSPTILFNGSLWAQCDVIYTFFLIVALYYWLQPGTDPRWPVLWFAVALMFKLQAVFFVLVLLFLYTRKGVSLGWLLAIPACTWFLTVGPHWLLGRELPDLLLIYFRQVVRYPSLTLYAPSLYGLLPGAPFESFQWFGLILLPGILVIAMYYMLQPGTFGNQPVEKIQIALLSALIIPFLLPKMHERYFFLADVLSLVYVCYRPRQWYVALLINMASLFSYYPYLFKSSLLPIWACSAMMLAALMILLQTMWQSLRAASKEATAS
jgi:Gpi18-like mannosyltransferase